MSRNNELIISAYGSHNAAVSMYYKGRYWVVEVERWLNSKNAGLTSYNPVRNIQFVFDEICDYLLNQTDRSDVDTYISGYMGKFTPKFFYKKQISCDHHMAHAADAFYQSSYQSALVYTFDGGGDGGFFNVYLADRTTGIKLIRKFDQDLGFPYMILADYLEDIKKETLTVGNLVYAGKLMGLCSYGKVREEWVVHFEQFYEKFNYKGDSYIGGAEVSHAALTELFKAIGVDFDFNESRFEGQLAWDIAATTQQAFENQFFKFANQSLEQYSTLPVCLAGGCALNVLLNSKILIIKNGDVFVPPNTNDCGISVGGILWYLNPSNQVDLTYCGLEVMDDHRLAEYLEAGDYSMETNVSIESLARFLANGKIIGFIDGQSEHGSRALGNRSIICNPAEGMKDILNKKVKNREWYRPFAPMVRLEEADKYFHFNKGESRHMTFVGVVRDEWKAHLPAITHEDGTGRLQTVTRTQNEFIYDLLGEFGKLSGHAVLLNTSFNVNGKPILTRLSDAFEILSKTGLDAIFYKNNLIFMRKNSDSFLQTQSDVNKTNEINKIDFNIFAFEDNLNINHYNHLLNIIFKEKKIIPHIITDYDNSMILKRGLVERPFTLEVVGNNRHYHTKLLKLNNPATKQCADVLKLLWAKESLRDISNRGYKQIFANGSVLSEPAIINIFKTIDEEVMSNKDTVYITKSESLPIKQLEKHFKKTYKTLPKHSITSDVFFGTKESILFFLDHYEAMLMLFIKQEMPMSETDYLTASFISNQDRYKIFEG